MPRQCFFFHATVCAVLAHCATAGAQTAPLPEGAPPEGEVEPERVRPAAELREERAGSSYGIGGGGVWIDQVRGPSGGSVLPAISLTARKIFMLTPGFGFELGNAVSIHDFETIGSVYRWYGNGENQGVKFLLLWPGLVLAPFFGANIGGTAGAIGYFRPVNPAPWLAGGLQLNLYLRPSEPAFRADFGPAVYLLLGVDFTRVVGLAARFEAGVPIFHAAEELSRWVVQSGLMLTLKPFK